MVKRPPVGKNSPPVSPPVGTNGLRPAVDGIKVGAGVVAENNISRGTYENFF